MDLRMRTARLVLHRSQTSKHATYLITMESSISSAPPRRFVAKTGGIVSVTDALDALNSLEDEEADLEACTTTSLRAFLGEVPGRTSAEFDAALRFVWTFGDFDGFDMGVAIENYTQK